MTLFSSWSTSLKPHSLGVPADRVARSSSGSHSRSEAAARSATAADMSRQRGGRGPAGTPGGHGRNAETRNQPRLPQAAPSVPPSLRPPGAHHHGGDDGQQRVTVGQQPVRGLRAAARLRAQGRSPRSRHSPAALGGGGAALALPSEGRGTLLSRTMGRCP